MNLIILMYLINLKYLITFITVITTSLIIQNLKLVLFNFILNAQKQLFNFLCVSRPNKRYR